MAIGCAELVLLAMMLGGIIMLILGFRGRVIDDHPVCRNCGFDLHGKPPDSNRCAECGADVSRIAAIRIGHRRRRAGLVWGGAALFAPAFLITVLGIVVGLRGLDPIGYMPLWWLMNDADRSAAPVRDNALREIARRAKSNQLSDGQLRTVAARALEAQADRSRAWVPLWGDVFEAAHTANAVTAEQWKQYVYKAPQWTLDARPRVRQGAPLAVRFSRDDARLGTNTQMWFNYTYTDVLIDGKPCSRSVRGSGGGSNLSVGGGGSSSQTVEPDDAAMKDLAPGPHRVTVRMEIRLYDLPYAAAQTATPLVTQTIALDSDWELVNEPTVRVVTDPSLRPAVEKSVRITRVARQAYDPDHISVEVEASSPPVGLGYAVILRAGNREHNVGSVSFKAVPASAKMGGGHSWHTGSQVRDLKADVCDVILRPSLNAVEATVDLTEMWDGELVFKDVKIEGPKRSPTETSTP